MNLAPVPAGPLRAAGYVRVSMVGGRGDDMMSPDLQLAAIRAWCDRHGAELVEIVEDIDKSGRSWRPRQIGRLVDQVSAGQLDAIVVWKWSRFARSRVDWAVHVDRVESAGGRLASATEDVDTTTSAGRFARGMLAELAAFESERIGEGWQAVHRARFEAGLPPASYPFGWRRAGRGIEAHPDEAPIVVELYRRYLAGDALRQLALDLNARGIATRRGGLWAADSIRYLLDSPIHAGLVTLNGQTRPGQHAGIIDERTRAAYLAARRRGRAAPRRAESPYLLSGLIVCSSCGRPMAGNSGGTRSRWPQYRCTYTASTAAHPASTISVRKADGAVLAWLADRAAGINDSAARLPAGPVSVPDVDRLAGRLADIDRKLAALLLRELDGTPATVIELARADLGARRAELVAQLEAEQERRAIASPAPQRAALDLLDDWDVLTVAGRREALRALIRCVVVHYRPGRVVIEER